MGRNAERIAKPKEGTGPYSFMSPCVAGNCLTIKTNDLLVSEKTCIFAANLLTDRTDHGSKEKIPRRRAELRKYPPGWIPIHRQDPAHL